MQLLRHQTNQAARGAVVAHGVVTIDQHRALAGLGHATDNADERGFARTVGAKQRQNFASVDVEVDVFKGGEAAGVGFAQATNGDDGVWGS